VLEAATRGALVESDWADVTLIVNDLS